MQFRSLPGLQDYEAIRKLQLELVESRARDEIPDTVLFLEHTPVITRGRGLQFTGTPRPRHMPLPLALPPGIQFCESERGGDLTYHGPGQLVIYPIFKLDGQGFGPKHNVTGFLRKFEQILISALGEFLKEKIYTQKDATGVWVEASGLPPKKIASIGIAVRKWVTYHGLAINLTTDLSPFLLISPCGFSSEVMTSLHQWVALPKNWREVFEQILIEKINSASHPVPPIDLKAPASLRHSNESLPALNS